MRYLRATIRKPTHKDLLVNLIIPTKSNPRQPRPSEALAKEDMSIKDLPKHLRPREKLIDRGVENLKDKQ